jgi:hypothetical protein
MVMYSSIKNVKQVRQGYGCIVSMVVNLVIVVSFVCDLQMNVGVMQIFVTSHESINETNEIGTIK